MRPIERVLIIIARAVLVIIVKIIIMERILIALEYIGITRDTYSNKPES